MKSDRARAPSKPATKKATTEELLDRLDRASRRPDGAENIRRLLALGADPAPLTRPQEAFLRVDTKCWLMRVAQMANAPLLGLAWQAIEGSKNATPEKLISAVFICAWRADASAFEAWLPKAWKKVKGSDSMAREGASQAIKMKNAGALEAFGRLIPDFVHQNTGDQNLPPLLSASALSCVKTAEALLRLGADPEARDAQGRSALLLAASLGFAPSVRLLSSVADIRAVSAQGEGLKDWRPGASEPLALAIDEALAKAEALELRESAGAPAAASGVSKLRSGL